MNCVNFARKVKMPDEITEGKLIEVWPSCASEAEGIHPGSEVVAGKGSQEAFLRSVAMSNEDPTFEKLTDLRIEREQGRRTG